MTDITEIEIESGQNYALRAPVSIKATRGIVSNCSFMIEFKDEDLMSRIPIVEIRSIDDNMHITGCFFQIKQVELYHDEEPVPILGKIGKRLKRKIDD